jgi:hypothetical protein
MTNVSGRDVSVRSVLLTSDSDQKARRNSRLEFVKKEVAGSGNGLAVANAAPAPAPGFGSNEIPFDVQRVRHQSTESSRLCFSNGNLTAQFLGKPLSLQDEFSPGNATYNRKVTLRANILNC